MMRLTPILCAALLAGATAIHADIIHSPTNFLLGYVWFPENEEFFDLDLDSDGSVDFSLVASLNHFSGIHSETQNKYLIHPSPPPNIGGPVAALDSGYIIGSNSGENSPEEWFGIDDWGGLIIILNTGEAGEFLRHRGFVGLEFEAADGTHYGWLDIEGVPNGGSYIWVHGWAYESTPGVGIAAGAVPEPSSGILFAIGAIGAWTLRRRKTP